MDSKPNPQLLAYAMGAALVSSGGAGGFLDELHDERRFFPLDMASKRAALGYGFYGRKLDRSPAAKKALAKKKASKKARKANRRG